MIRKKNDSVRQPNICAYYRVDLLTQAGMPVLLKNRYLKIAFEPDIESAERGDVGTQAHHEVKFGEDDGCYWNDREGITHSGVIVEDFVCDEGDGGGPMPSPMRFTTSR